MKLDNGHVAKAALPAGKTDVCYWDDTLTGFGVRVREHAGGVVRKTYVCQYRNAAGFTRRFLIGDTTKLSPAMARGEAKRVLAQAQLGGDPQAERVKKRVADDALGKVAELYLQRIATRKRPARPNTMLATRRYLLGPYFKKLHKVKITSITRKDVSSCTAANIAAHGNISAARARETLSALFSWAMGEGLVEANPIIGSNAPEKNEPRSRVLSNEELVKVWHACSSRTDDYGRIIRLLILLGARRQEVGGMRWSEIDLDQKTWTLPVERSKNHKALTLPLIGQALDIIRSTPRKPGREQVFGFHAAEGFTSWDYKVELDQQTGIKGMTLHDLRRSFSTGLGNLSVQPHVIEECLNHKRPGVAGTYNRSPYEREVRAALALWDDHIRTLVTGEESKVIPFEQRA
jgi:integrase